MADNKKVNPERTYLNMQDRRKAIDTLYKDDTGVRTYTRQSTGAVSTVFTEAKLNTILNNVGSNNADITEQLKLSNYAYATNANYQNIIDYFANMYQWRYYYIPVAMREKASKTTYEEIYKLMTDVIDGINFEVAFPVILTNLFKDGIVYIYTDKNTSAKTVSTFILDPRYCSPIMMSQYGTGIFQFNAKYFDDLGIRAEQKEEILSLYPDELVAAYKTYQGDRSKQYAILDGRYSCFVRLNDYNFPNRLTVVKSLIDYEAYRANEVERSGAQLDRIISHKIPTYENELLFELDEIKALHRSMSQQISSNTRTRLVTTFGDIEVHQLADSEKVQNEVLEKAHDAIYNSAGVNNSLFNGAIAESLQAGLDRDAAYVWKYIQELMNFYNITINNLYNFKGYQAELVMLPITCYNASEMLSTYKGNAEYGVGRLELIIASGTKQKHIIPKAELEDFLKLDEILKPLQSTHTQPGGSTPASEAEPKESETKESEEPPVPEEEKK